MGRQVETVTDLTFLGSKMTADGHCSHEIKICLLLGRKVITNLDSILISRDIILPTNVHLVKAIVFPIVMNHEWMWELDYKESWVLKNWCFWTVVLEKTLESPLDCKEIQPVHPKGNQFWMFIGRTDVEAETPILWPPDANNGLIWKDPDAGKDWRQKEKGTTEDGGWMASPTQWTRVCVNSGSWWCIGGPGRLQPRSRKVSDITEWLNWTDRYFTPVTELKSMLCTTLKIYTYFYHYNHYFITLSENRSNVWLPT